MIFSLMHMLKYFIFLCIMHVYGNVVTNLYSKWETQIVKKLIRDDKNQ